MSQTSTIATLDDVDLVAGVLQGVMAELSGLIASRIELDACRAQRMNRRPVGADQVHVSFRQVYGTKPAAHGCLLVPLPAAQALAGYFLMLPSGRVAERRMRDDLDVLGKDALLVLSGHIARAIQDTLASCAGLDVQVRSGGCQGVRAGVRPTLSYKEGAPLLVGRAAAVSSATKEFESILVLPRLPTRT